MSRWLKKVPLYAVLIVLVGTLARHSRASLPAPTRVQAAATPDRQSDPSPTLANYERVAARSLDDLDDLLTRQALKRHAPTPTYKASLLAFANAGE